jgi:hypothetical protein
MIYDVIGNEVVFNVSKGLANYTQRNNEYVWTKKNLIVNSINVCNTTSICMGSSYAGWHFPQKPYSQYKQEEDRLTAFCLEDRRVSEFYRNKMPTLWNDWQNGVKNALTPNQVHRVLEYATNTWFGTKVVTFSDDVYLGKIIYEIVDSNLPVVVSGNFPKSYGSKETIGHIVVLVGLIYKKKDIISRKGYDVSNPTHFIFDDPWGNFIEGYEKKLPGNDIICPYDLALKYLKPIDRKKYKWAYTFTRGAAVS